MAKQSGFMRRKSPISPTAFLETIFFSNNSYSPSLSQYSAELLINRGVKVSKQAINKRFKSNAKQFIQLIVDKVIRLQFSKNSHWDHLRTAFSEVRIMDSTLFKVSPSLSDSFPGFGGKGREAIAKIQFEYELFNSSMTRLTLGNSLDSDLTQSLNFLDTIPKGTLLLRDLGYISLDVCGQYLDRGLYFVSKIKPQWTIYREENGKLEKWSTESIIAELTKSKQKYLDENVFIGSKEKVPVRLTAHLLSEQIKNRRLRRKQVNKGKTNKNDQINSSVNILITNVSEDTCSAEKIYDLYTLRWQIELIFKTWKSVLNIHKIGTMNAKRFEALIYIKFLWVLLNWSLLAHFNDCSQEELSLMKTTYMMRSQCVKLMLALKGAAKTLYNWLEEFIKVSLIYHKKEYKKGSLKIEEIMKLS